ncbi:MAG: phage protease, partial [bacterium]
MPDWVQLTPPGPAIVGRDGRAWTLSDPAAVAAAFDPAKEPQIDLEHSSQIAAPLGMPAPAVGWIKELNVRDGALWGRVEWTAEGEATVT